MGRLTQDLRPSSSPGSQARARARVTAAVSSRAAPHSRRPGVRAPASTAASRSACAGAVRPARQDAAATPSSATSRPVQKARWYGQPWAPISNQAGARPASAAQAARYGAPRPPSTQPVAAASSPTSSASAATVRRSRPGVAPTVRSRPNSRRRWATVKANVDATTNTETNAVTPPAVPNRAFIAVRASASRSGPGSARRRAAPVRTWTPGASATAARTAAGAASTTSRVGAAGARAAARASVTKRAASRRAVPGSAVPTTWRTPWSVCRRSPGRTPGPVATASWGAFGARPAVRSYGVNVAIDQGRPVSRVPSAARTGNARSSATGPSRFRRAMVCAGTGRGWARRWTRSPTGVGTRRVSWPWTTTGAAANRSGARSGTSREEARARPVTVSRATPSARAVKLPTKVTQRARRVRRAVISTAGTPGRPGRRRAPGWSCARRWCRRSRR
ncbi:hypothetical protein SGLAM104S_01545 [Streptomyces glaucescens]